MKASHFSPDTLEFLLLLNKYRVKYLIVGGEAVIYYGHIRLTGDIDFFYDASQKNVQSLFNALAEFWGGTIPGISSHDELSVPGTIIQFGAPPNRIDLINKVDGVDFNLAWESKTETVVEANGNSIPVHYISLELLIKNKETVARYKDQDDLRFLKASLEKNRR
ncbi:MAG: nucleotidyltransferase [Spirochaetes bacterium]|nr:nucleotidyltransferase [Spirochaetota bacterium]